MKTTLDSDVVDRLVSGLEVCTERNVGGRSPVHTVYGGAQLFSKGTIAKLGAMATASLEKYAESDGILGEIFQVSPGAAAVVRSKIAAKLAAEAVEDFRIDFEDGYGVRSEADEDEHTVSAAAETVAAIDEDLLPGFFGIRVKAVNGVTGRRSLRTLDLFLTKLLSESNGRMPKNFVVTLPKVERANEVSTLCSALGELERVFGLANGSIKIEIMVETAECLIDRSGRSGLSAIVNAAEGRCVAAHFGAYDYLSELGVSASEQSLRHRFCDMARGLMKLSLVGRSVDLVDGATNLMPVPIYRGEDLTEAQSHANHEAVHAAWRLHFDNVRHGLAHGFYRGWDLHPGQFIARYAAVYSFFLESADEASARLRSFLEKGARANLVGNSFDDAATGQGLLNYFRRALDCGAMTADELIERTGITAEDIRVGSFEQIVLRIGSHSYPPL